MDKRREALKNLLKALKKDYSVFLTEDDKKRLEQLNLEDQVLDIWGNDEEYDFLYENDPSFREEQNDSHEISIMKSDFKSLEDAAEKITSQNLGGAYILDVFDEIPDEISTELRDGFWENDGKHIIMNGEPFVEWEAIRFLGESFGRLGIKVDDLPSIVLHDTSFIISYFENFPIKEDKAVREGHPDYNFYSKGVDFVKRIQAQLDLRHEKEEQMILQGRAKTISEAEALVDQQQGQQQE